MKKTSKRINFNITLGNKVFYSLIAIVLIAGIAGIVIGLNPGEIYGHSSAEIDYYNSTAYVGSNFTGFRALVQQIVSGPTNPCNNNGVCESSLGETVANCFSDCSPTGPTCVDVAESTIGGSGGYSFSLSPSGLSPNPCDAQTNGCTLRLTSTITAGTSSTKEGNLEYNYEDDTWTFTGISPAPNTIGQDGNNEITPVAIDGSGTNLIQIRDDHRRGSGAWLSNPNEFVLYDYSATKKGKATICK